MVRLLLAAVLALTATLAHDGSSIGGTDNRSRITGGVHWAKSPCAVCAGQELSLGVWTLRELLELLRGGDPGAGAAAVVATLQGAALVLAHAAPDAGILAGLDGPG